MSTSRDQRFHIGAGGRRYPLVEQKEREE